MCKMHVLDIFAAFYICEKIILVNIAEKQNTHIYM